jgi:hypothetical protein
MEMNALAISVSLLCIALVILVSGCVSGPQAGPGDGSGTTVTEGQSAEQQDAQALSQVGEGLISEDDTVEIGEMV